MWNRMMRWEFAALLGLTLLDAVVFVIPLVPVALLLAALVAPDWLRRAARALDSLAAVR